MDEAKLRDLLMNNLFLLPLDVPCEFCDHNQRVTIPVRVTEVGDGWIRGSSGSAVFPCANCGKPAGIDWDAVNIQITQFLKE
jgi:hypothetical protein